MRHWINSVAPAIICMNGSARLFFLYAIHRFHLPRCLEREGAASLIPVRGFEHLLQRRFEEAIDQFVAVQEREGPSDAISSALATAYHRLAFQTLADQVRAERAVGAGEPMDVPHGPSGGPTTAHPAGVAAAKQGG